MKPLVYLREDQINSLYERQITKLQVTDGDAYAWDEYTVFHAFTTTPAIRPAGVPMRAKFIRLPSIDSWKEWEAAMPAFVSESDSHQVLFIVLAIDGGVLKHKCYFLNEQRRSLPCDVKFVPEKSDLYSRSKGLLETGALAKKSVGIVGLGSGGSVIAVELAKAGVGNFVLIDFDRLELSNVSRHVCGITDLGRYKTFAVRDALLQKNPHAGMTTLEIDVTQNRDECSKSLSKVDLIICASDNDQSRFFLNEIALKYRRPAIFGRAITRATGGDVLRVRPFQGPCYSCLYSQNVRQQGGDDEEISQRAQAKQLLPGYTSEGDIKAVIQVGLSSDIAPISNFVVKLALVELSKGLDTGIKSLEEDLVADFYIWANRRDQAYENWSKLEFNFNKPSILRWYGARVERDPNCLVCGQ